MRLGMIDVHRVGSRRSCRSEMGGQRERRVAIVRDVVIERVPGAKLFRVDVDFQVPQVLRRRPRRFWRCYSEK